MEFIYNTKDNRVECTLFIQEGLIFKGVAKVHPDDTFLKGTGESISQLRAYQKFLKWENKMVLKSIEHRNRDIEDIEKQIKKEDENAQIYHARLARARKRLNR